jgi:NADH dehydrogenase
MLAAVFLTSDARRYSDVLLERYFRIRAIVAAVVAGLIGVVAIFVLGRDAPYMRDGLTHEALPLVIASFVLGIATLVSIHRSARRGTRLFAVGTVAAVLWAWGVAQYPYLLPQTLTLDQAAGNIHTLSWIVVAFAVAAAAVFPLLALLYVLDQRGRLEEGVVSSADGPRHRVVIVGGGFGGLPAARLLGLSECDVVLVDRRNHHLFQPLLYQVATGILSPGQIAPPLRRVLRHHKNTAVELAEVTDFDLARRVVIVRRFLGAQTEIPYDSLIVAAGAGQSYFGHDELARFAPGMKTLDDALEIRRRVFGALEMAESATDPDDRARWMTIVVVGAGPTGVELAGQIRELAVRSLKGDFRAIDPAAVRVLLLDAGEEPLATFGDKLSGKAVRGLEKLGVELRMGTRVTDIDLDGVSITGPDGTDHIPARTAIWAAGVAASPLAAQLAQQTGAELDRAGRIQVLPDLSLPGHPEVFVVGDMMALDGLPGVAEVAMQGGLHAAHTILRRHRGDPAAKAFRYRDLGSMATIGRFRAVLSAGRLRLSGFPAWLVWVFVHLAFLCNFGNRVSTVARWAGSMIGHQRDERNFSVGRTAGDVSLPDDVREGMLPPRFPVLGDHEG